MTKATLSGDLEEWECEAHYFKQEFALPMKELTVFDGGPF